MQTFRWAAICATLQKIGSRSPAILGFSRPSQEANSLKIRSRPQQTGVPRDIHMDMEKARALTEEIGKLFAIIPVPDSGEGFTSSIFLVPKSDGSWRPMVNLKPLNEHIISRHFKMESVRTAKSLLQREDWLVKLDLKDAYLTPMHQEHQKFLKFRWHNQSWQFKVLPFGLSSAPYTFTKLMKLVVSLLRSLSIRMILYLDDMLIMTETPEEVSKHLATALDLLVGLGFVINIPKSSLTPKQRLEFLGIRPGHSPDDNSTPRHQTAWSAEDEQENGTTGGNQPEGIGPIAGYQGCPAILPAPLHYRCLEITKSQALRKGLPYETEVQVDAGMLDDLRWWQDKLSRHNGRTLQVSQWDVTIESDASMMGWGASCQDTPTGGPWTREEKANSIDYLELLAAFLALQSFASEKRSVRILLCIDNITAIAFLNRMGGPHSHVLSDLAIEVWEWCLRRDIIIHAEHLPGKENIRADWESRHTSDCSDWMLAGGDIWSLLGRFVHIEDECPTANIIILLLESRPHGLDSGCLLNLMGRDVPLPFPSLCSYSRLSGQDQPGGGVGSIDCTRLAGAAMVPSTSPEVNEITNPPTSHSGYCLRP